jgi:7-cyano-7-deazaguanine reductase
MGEHPLAAGMDRTPLISPDNLSLLGASQTEYPSHPDEAKLETISNQWQENNYLVELDCPEFTCVCPKTGQPDFARIQIKYIPDQLLIESKALKLYLFAFRNQGIFHEFAINKIAHDLAEAIKPKYLEVRGEFMPRGGIAINPSVRLGDKGLVLEFC